SRRLEFRFQIRDVVKAGKLHAGDDRSKGQAVFLRCCDTDSAKRTAMKGILQSQETVLFRRCAGRLLRIAPMEPRQLHRAIDGFRAAVREEHAIEPGPFRELRSEEHTSELQSPY